MLLLFPASLIWASQQCGCPRCCTAGVGLHFAAQLLLYLLPQGVWTRAPLKLLLYNFVCIKRWLFHLYSRQQGAVPLWGNMCCLYEAKKLLLVSSGCQATSRQKDFSVIKMFSRRRFKNRHQVKLKFDLCKECIYSVGFFFFIIKNGNTNVNL